MLAFDNWGGVIVCTTGVMTEGRMAGGVGTVWEREKTVQV